MNTTSTTPTAPSAQKQLAARNLNMQGVKITLLDDRQQPIPVSSNGYIGRKFYRGDTGKLSVLIEIVRGASLLCVEINETTNEVRQIESKPAQDGGLTYERPITIASDAHGTLYGKRDESSLRLVGVRADGECILWNIAIVSQGGHFFLTYQTICSHYGYRDGDRVRIPGMQTAKKWMKLGLFLENMLTSPELVSALSLKPIAEYVAERKTYAEGEVKWYSQRQQLGCIHTHKGDARVHWTSIKTERPDRLKYLMPGEIVEFDLRAPQGRKPGDRGTGFDWEAINVTVRS